MRGSERPLGPGRLVAASPLGPASLHGQASPLGRDSPLNQPRWLVVMARWPSPGRCKRRLAAGLGPGPDAAVRAAQIQARLLGHTLAVARAARAQLGLELVLAVDGLGARARRRWGQHLALGQPAPQGQGPGGLGLRMQRQWQRAFGAGAAQVVLIGTDLPDLAVADLVAAFGALDAGPLVLGPALDGGYWLIGLNRSGFHQAGPALTAGQPWGTDRVLNSCLEAARQRGLSAHLLRHQADLDRRADLAPWLEAHSPTRWLP